MLLLELLSIILSKLMYVGIGITGVGFLIGFHELGHYIFCKIFNIETPNFSIGFGPVLLSKKIGETVFSLSAIPLGGYVEIAGSIAEEHQPSAEETVTNKRLFSNKPFYQQLMVMVGGIGFNLAFAYIVLIVLAYVGLPNTPLLTPHNSLPVISQFSEISAGRDAGLMINDTILSINETPINGNVATLIKEISNKPDQTVAIMIARGEETVTLPVKIGSNNANLGSLGVSFSTIEKPGIPLKEAISYGITLANEYIINTVYAFKNIITKKKADNMAGPLMIIHLVGTGATKGFKTFLIFLAIISINLAILNLIPLPIFDGGQILFYGMEALLKIKRQIHLISWVMILILALYLSFKDINTFAQPAIQKIAKKIGLLS